MNSAVVGAEDRRLGVHLAMLEHGRVETQAPRKFHYAQRIDLFITLASHSAYQSCRQIRAATLQ